LRVLEAYQKQFQLNPLRGLPTAALVVFILDFIASLEFGSQRFLEGLKELIAQ